MVFASFKTFKYLLHSSWTIENIIHLSILRLSLSDAMRRNSVFSAIFSISQQSFSIIFFTACNNVRALIVCNIMYSSIGARLIREDRVIIIIIFRSKLVDSRGKNVFMTINVMCTSSGSVAFIIS